MLGLIAKSWREVRTGTLLFGTGLLIVECLLCFILPEIQEEINDLWMRVPFARTLVNALMGVDIEDGLTAQMLQSIVWVHPVVLALTWAHEIMFCTRVPAGEIDRGTVDILLGLPVSRRAVYLSETFVWLATGVLIISMGFAGAWLGLRELPPGDRPAPAHIALVFVNMMCLYVAVGGLALLVSALSSHRGRAVGVIFAVVLGSFLLNFLAGFWPPAGRLVFLSVLDYYQPANIVSAGRIPITDLVVLLGVGGVAWIAGGEIMARRSICTT